MLLSNNLEPFMHHLISNTTAPNEMWLRRRPDLMLHGLLHRTANGGVRSDCDTRLLEMHITTKSITVSEIEIPIPATIHSVPLPIRHGNEGIEHRELRRLSLALAQAIDPRALVIEEHRVGCGASHAVIDVWAETRFGG